MHQWLGILLLAVSTAASAGDDPTADGAAHVVVRGELQQAASAIQGRAPAFSVKRYEAVAASPQAYQRLESALLDLAKQQGLGAGDAERGMLTVEVDSTFYVYTNRFNARLVRLPEYTQAQLDGVPTDDTARSEQKPDLVRIAAGALGIVRGWISPAFGSYMMATGSAPTLFGSGRAPTRLFVAGKERYERGEQEVNTKVRLLRDNEVVASFTVRNWARGDEPPFEVDALVAANWTKVMAVLTGRQVEPGAVAGDPEFGGISGVQPR